MNLNIIERYEYEPVQGYLGRYEGPTFWALKREPTIRRSKRGQRAAEAKKWWVRR